MGSRGGRIHAGERREKEKRGGGERRGGGRVEVSFLRAEKVGAAQTELRHRVGLLLFLLRSNRSEHEFVGGRNEMKKEGGRFREGERGQRRGVSNVEWPFFLSGCMERKRRGKKERRDVKTPIPFHYFEQKQKGEEETLSRENSAWRKRERER